MEQPSQEKRTTLSTAPIEKIGSAAGSGIATLAALLILLCFMLPWASCGNYEFSGLDIATDSGDTVGEGAACLCAVPLTAFVILGLGLLLTPYGFLAENRVIKWIGSAVQGLAALLGTISAILFFIRTNALKNDPQTFGMIHIRYGFWGALIGYLGAILGSLIGFAAPFVGLFAERKKGEQ